MASPEVRLGVVPLLVAALHSHVARTAQTDILRRCVTVSFEI